VNYVPKHSRDHPDSEYISWGLDDNGAEFINNKQQTNKEKTLNFIISADYLE